MTDNPEDEVELPEPQPGGTNSYLGGGITGTMEEMSTYTEPPGVGGVGGTFRENEGAEPPGIAPTGTGVQGLHEDEPQEKDSSGS